MGRAKICSFPILSHVAQTILVTSASSAESERHFNGAGRIACKDRNQLKDDAVENSVIFYEEISIKSAHDKNKHW